MVGLDMAMQEVLADWLMGHIQLAASRPSGLGVWSAGRGCH